MRKFNITKSNLRTAGISFLTAGMIASFAALFSPDSSPILPESGENQSQEAASQDIMSLEVSENSTAEGIGQALRDEGMIEDTTAFQDFMRQNGYHESLQPGEYQINSDMTMKDIAQVITGSAGTENSGDTE